MLLSVFVFESVIAIVQFSYTSICFTFDLTSRTQIKFIIAHTKQVTL